MSRRLPKFLLINLLFLFITLFGLANNNWATEGPTVKIYLFWAHNCPHCLHEKEFLAKLESKDKNIKIIALEVTERRENLELLKKVGEFLGVQVPGVPFTVVGNRYFVGWQDEQTTGVALERALQDIRLQGAPDVIANLIAAPGAFPPSAEIRAIPEKLTLPFLGEIEIKHLSLGLLTALIAGLDGFNPCAMWVLVFLINLLLGLEDRKKMWILGGIFIISSGMVYFLFMTAWLNLLLFIGFILWVRILIGLVALFAGGYNLREYLTNKTGACKLSYGTKRQKTLEKIKDTIHAKKFLMAIIRIVLLAFAVNLVELICSAGFPVVYLQILSLNPMPIWQYYLYLILYILIFIMDDLIVFTVAMITLEAVGLTTKYKRASNLIGGVLMLIIGVGLIFKPEFLMFG